MPNQLVTIIYYPESTTYCFCSFQHQIKVTASQIRLLGRGNFSAGITAIKKQLLKSSKQQKNRHYQFEYL